MKFTNNRNRIFSLIFCGVLLVSQAFAQSGDDEKFSFQQSAPSVEIKLPDDIEKPKYEYEYIAPRNIYLFMNALREAGKRGFKLDKWTSLPSIGIEVDKRKLNGTVLAGTVKFDGAKRFDYDFFFAEGEKDPELTLNALAKNGWALREVITITNSGDEDSLNLDGSFANQLKKLPLLGNIYLLERAEGDKTTRGYKLFKAAVGTGRSPSPKLQEMLDKSVAENYTPVASYTSFSTKGFLKIDAFAGILVENRAADKNLEYKFVRGNSSEDLWKDIDAASKEGFRIDSMSYGTAILTRETGKNAPENYTRLDTFAKIYQTDLAATLSKNPNFYAAGIYSYPQGSMNKNILIFGNGAANAEFKVVRIVPAIPKQFRKNPDEFYKTVELPNVVFQKTLDENFHPRDIFYSETEGLMMIFERDNK